MLLSIKNEQGANGGGNQNSSMINDDSALNPSSVSGQHHYGSPSSTNPFDRVKVKEDLDGPRGPQRRDGKAKEKAGKGSDSIKSQSLFSNYYSGKRARTLVIVRRRPARSDPAGRDRILE